jgi:hypothetical protein
VIPAPSGEAGRRAEAARWRGGAGEEEARGDCRRGAGRRSIATGQPTEQEQHRRRAEQSRAGLSSLFSFPYLTGTTEETDVDAVIKNERAQSRGLLG